LLVYGFNFQSPLLCFKAPRSKKKKKKFKTKVNPNAVNEGKVVPEVETC